MLLMSVGPGHKPGGCPEGPGMENDMDFMDTPFFFTLQRFVTNRVRSLSLVCILLLILMCTHLSIHTINKSILAGV